MKAENGGQRGCASPPENQELNFPTPEKPAIEKSGETDALPNRVADAAAWLAVHRDEVIGAPIPFVKNRFGLSNFEAVDALRRGRALRIGG